MNLQPIPPIELASPFYSQGSKIVLTWVISLLGILTLFSRELSCSAPIFEFLFGDLYWVGFKLAFREDENQYCHNLALSSDEMINSTDSRVRILRPRIMHRLYKNGKHFCARSGCPTNVIKFERRCLPKQLANPSRWWSKDRWRCWTCHCSSSFNSASVVAVLKLQPAAARVKESLLPNNDKFQFQVNGCSRAHFPLTRRFPGRIYLKYQ